MNLIKTIALDADDTLWINEPFFREAEHKFCSLLEEYMPLDKLEKVLYRIEMDNLPLYGYGIKGFVLSMIETAQEVIDGKVENSIIKQCINIGKEMLDKPVELLDGVMEVVQKLSANYRLVLATKGDLLDQERKLEKSGLSDYFDHVEIMSNKEEMNYQKLLSKLDCSPSEFLMVGNSLKSDVLPVIELGGYGIHIPYHVTWEHEKIDKEVSNPRFRKLERITQLTDTIKSLI